MEIDVFVARLDDITRYSSLVADILNNDEAFQKLIKSHGKEAHLEAIDIIIGLELECFTKGTLPHVAADQIRAFFRLADNNYQASREAFYAELLNSIPIDKTH